MNETRQVASALRTAIVLGVGSGIALAIAELVWIDIGGLMPNFSLSETILSFGVLALFGFLWLEVRDGGIER